MELKINLADYLSQDEIKEAVREQIKCEVSNLFRNEENAKRLLSNLSYEIVFNEIDKVIPNSRNLVIQKTESILNDIKSYQVFRDASYGGKKSIAYELMENSVKNNVELLNEKVKETIINKDYSKEIWDKFENLADSFMSNIYTIVELGRNKK